MAIIREVWEGEVYEKEVQIQSGDIVVDAGAHIGSFTFKIAKKAKKVIAFEPEPSNFKLLCINTKDLENVDIYNSALWSKSGTAMLQHNKFNIGGSTLLPVQPGVSDYSIEVETVRMDDIVYEADFIKMDIEGAEFEALRGAEKILKSHHPVIVIEVHPITPLNEWWNDLSSLFQQFNYSVKNFPSPSNMWQSRIITAI